MTDKVSSMEGKKVLVVGASSGIGAATALAASDAGALVAGIARREMKMAQQFIGPLPHDIRVLPIKGDVTSSQDIERAVREADNYLGGFDLVLFCAGFSRLMRLSDIELDTMDVWQELYATNVVGANLATAAALPYLNKDGVIGFLSSRTVDDKLALLSPYTASKAALDQCIRTWRVEEPEHRFTRVVMGWVGPTEIADNLGPLMGEAFDHWAEQGAPGGIMDTNDTAQAMIKQFDVMLEHPNISFPELNLDMRYSGTPASWWGNLASMMEGS